MSECCLFFASSRALGLAGIVTAINFAKFPQGLSPPCKISWGVEPLSPSYSTAIVVETRKIIVLNLKHVFHTLCHTVTRPLKPQSLQAVGLKCSTTYVLTMF